MAEQRTTKTAIGGRSMGSAQRMARIEERLERIEALLTKLEPVLDNALPAVATVVDAIDERIMAAGDGLQLSERAEQALALVERITRPKTLAALQSAVDLAEQAPGVVATIADSVDELAARYGDSLQLYNRTQQLGALMEHATRPEVLAQMETLLGGLSMLAPAVEAANSAPAGRLGLLGLWRAMGDPDVQRAVHRGVEVARAAGKQMNGQTLSAAHSKELAES